VASCHIDKSIDVQHVNEDLNLFNEVKNINNKMYFATLLTNQQSQTPKTTANRPYSDQHHDRYESE